MIRIGYPLNIKSDQGPQFVSNMWTGHLKNTGINSTVNGVERLNEISVGEMYHAYLRKTFNEISGDFSGLPLEDVQDLSIKAMNDTAGQNGLLRTILVFGVLSRIPIMPGDLPDQVYRMKLMNAARI